MNQTQKNYAPQTCAWCSGTGEQAITLGYSRSCLVCGGKGHLLTAHPAGQCPECKGSGRRNAANPCLLCAGTGWARAAVKDK